MSSFDSPLYSSALHTAASFLTSADESATTEYRPAAGALLVVGVAAGGALEAALGWLRDHDHLVRHVDDVAGVAAALNDWQPDLVLLDLLMADQGTLARLRAVTGRASIVLLGSQADEAAAANAAAQSGADYLLAEQASGVRLAHLIRTARARQDPATDQVRLDYDRLATVVNDLRIAIALFDKDGRLALANEAWYGRGLIRREDAVGKRYSELIDPSLPGVMEIQESLDQVLVTGEPLIGRELHLHDSNSPDGRYFHATMQPVHDDAGNVTGVMKASIEITDALLTRQELEDQRALLQTLVAESPVGLVVYDRDMRIIHSNPEHERITGISQESIGQILYEVAPYTNQRRITHDKALGGQNVDQTIYYEFPGLPPRYMDIRYRPIRNADGSVIGMLSTVVDITDRARNEKEIERQRALLQTIVEVAPFGMVYLNSELQVESMNASYSKLMGIEALSAIGQRISGHILSPEEQDDIYRRVLADESIDLQNRAYSDPVSREMGYYDLYYRPVREAEGAISGIVIAVVDVTGRYELERQKDEFLSLASHELRTPLTSIKGYTQMLLRKARTGDQTWLLRPLGIMDDQTDRLIRLVSDLLDVTRVERASLPLYPERFDLRALAEEMAAVYEQTAPEFEITLQLPDHPLEVMADRQRIGQVLTNLLENAIKYSGRSRRVDFSLSEVDGEAVVAVRDYGVGIPADQQQQVFDRFFRGRNAGSHVRNGLGLGLFICYDITTRHGGRIWLESQQDVGSTFYLGLPLGEGARP